MTGEYELECRGWRTLLARCEAGFCARPIDLPGIARNVPASSRPQMELTAVCVVASTGEAGMIRKERQEEALHVE